MHAPPFEFRDGEWHLEQVPLSALAADLAGLPGAWVLSREAVDRALAAVDGPRAVSPQRLSPPALLSLAAAAGHWAAVRSAHELRGVLEAGFPPERIVVRGRVKEDGLLRDALAARVAVVQGDAHERAVLERIAGALGHALPSATGAPRDMPAEAFGRCGGLLARVLRGAPDVALDAVLDGGRPAAAGGARPGALDLDPDLLWSAHAGGDPGPTLLLALAGPHADGRTDAGTLTGLGGVDESPPRHARLMGPLRRGDWALWPDPRATAWRAEFGVHPALPSMLVQGAAWRPLDLRSGPPPLEP